MSNAIEVSGLAKNFILPLTRRRVPALKDLSFSVKAGGLVGFLGANGAGKTTTLKIILRLIFADHGEVKIFGKNHNDLSVKNKIGFLTERPYFYDYLTGREFLTFCAKIFKKKDILKRIDPLLEEVGLSHAADRPLRRYSKGMLQRIGIAQALVNDPELLILDEPMSGLDPDGRSEVSKIIASCNKRGVTVMFSTHLLPDVETLCDRVIMIDHGKLIVESAVTDLLESQTKGFTLEIKKAGQNQNLSFNFEDDASLQAAIDQARKEQSRIIKVLPQRPSLEEVFLKLKGTGK
ncbi:MAG: ABC transporter ATP-binding protein [Oligoflexia bacterium]|nr:ABC transporter ATP-binding protein [Oligoflexia bacterium]